MFFLKNFLVTNFEVQQKRIIFAAKNLKTLPMSKLYSLWELICRFKYVVVMAFILLIVVVLDDNSLLNRHKRSVHMEQMRTEIERYKQEYAYADGRLRELENPAAVEKLAREKYFMKRDNEDLFVLVDELSEQPAEADSLQ